MSGPKLAAIPTRAAKAPEPRLVTVTIEDGPFAGWSATARADFRAGLLADMDSGSISKIIPALAEIIVSHNMPDAEGKVAADIRDVVPYDGLMTISGEIFGEIGKLPGR